ncbi:MAG: GMC family oxidoreductase [Caulobacteraceae bacterium]
MTKPAGDPALAAAIRAADPDRLGDSRQFDAIVIGGGAAGGLACLELTRAGLSVLLLDAGYRAPFWQSPLRQATAAFVKRVADPRLQTVLPPGMISLGRKALRAAGKLHQPVQTRCFAWELAPDAFVSDKDNPYVDEDGSRFDWFRAHQIGGRMTIPGHGRQYYRLGPQDLRPADGRSPPWPVSYDELSRWYDHVEMLLGMTSGGEDCPWVPSGKFAITSRATPAEAQTLAAIEARWPGQPTILGRYAPPLKGVEMAAATGRLACRQGAIVRNIELGPDNAARAVHWKDRATGADLHARAPIVFVCASALETTRILLQTRTADDRPIGAASGALGANLMDHVVVSAEGLGDALAGEPEPMTDGRCVYLPRADLRAAAAADSRGFGMQIYRWSTGKGRSHFTGVTQAEMTPRPGNRVILDPDRRDAWGLPVLRIACRYSQDELDLARDQSQALAEVAETLGVRLRRLDSAPAPPGSAIHEGGTARMGDSPANSVVGPDNQCWDAKGVYVTDGAAFPSQGLQKPTLTILALTARACASVVSGRRVARSGAANDLVSA